MHNVGYTLRNALPLTSATVYGHSIPYGSKMKPSQFGWEIRGKVCLLRFVRTIVETINNHL